MNRVERWMITLEFSATEETARKTREAILDTARNTPGFRPLTTISRLLEEYKGFRLPPGKVLGIKEIEEAGC